jgi:hypothetical protein
MARTARLAALAAALGLLVVVPAASAASGVSIGSSAQLVNKLYVDVPITYSCTAFPPGPYNFSSVFVSLEQANNKVIASGSAFNSSPMCDGATHTDVVAVYPSISSYTSTGVPFKAGAANASASVSDCSLDPSTFIQTCDNASTGPVTVKISSGNS